MIGGTSLLGLNKLTRRDRTVFAVRCRTYNAATARMHQLLLTVAAPEEIYFISDARDSVAPFPEDAQTIHLTPALLDRLGLAYVGLNAGWQCGDYCYYALADATDFDRAWLIEPDVAFARDVADFFQRMAKQPEDLLAGRVERREADWFWHQSMPGAAEVWAAFFPLTRMSRAAVAHLYERRRQLSFPEVGGNYRDYPNDEAFVATTLKAADFRIASLEDLLPGEFGNFQWNDRYLWPDVLEMVEGPAVLHSALDQADFADFVTNRLVASALRNRQFVDTAANSLSSCLPENRERFIELLASGIADEIRRRADQQAASGGPPVWVSTAAPPGGRASGPST